ncbi:MAG TPA: type II secretion system protein [Candidatus Enterousia avicola]|uniref:Type II secretion system protein n=1 Tax=Candidatus Enterousia avicola TaxID=2840787 RepID=A0A9D1MS07_9PROT|nr:type II secretion system protein [Candidatus Enterousia avicola]
MKQESGRSMIEMMGVLAIMGVITVGAIAAISSAMKSQKVNTVNDEVLQMVMQVKQLFGGYDDFSNINNATIFGAIGMSNKNPYGGTYEISVNPSNSRQFIVTINGLSQSECDAFVVKAWEGSVGYEMSGRTQSGASGSCDNPNGENFVQITYGE